MYIIVYWPGLKLQLQMQNTSAFQKIGAKLSDQGIPSKGKAALYSDAYLEKFVRSQTLTGHHPTSTCKMGALSDPTAVVDSELRSDGHSVYLSVTCSKRYSFKIRSATL